MTDGRPPEQASVARTTSENIARLITDPDTRRVCLGYLVESLDLADLNAPHHWGLVLAAGALELRVGKIAVLSLMPDRLRCIVDRAQIPADLRRDRRMTLRESSAESAHGVFASVRGSASVDLPAPLVVTAFPPLRDAHRFLIVKAGVNCRNYADVVAHDSDVLGGLALLVGRRLPAPARTRA